VLQEPGSDRRAFWILSRGLVRQNIFEVSESLPDSKRKLALGLLVRKWSPFPTSQFAVQWSGHRACVYAWDGAAVAAAIAATGYPAARCSVWPETFFRPPMADGFRLSAMFDGVEGQVWKSGFIAATRWWPTVPASRDWATFLRASGVDLTQVSLAAPPHVQSQLLPQPWTMIAATATDLWSLVQNERATAIAAMVVAVPFLYYLTQSAFLLAATLKVENSISNLTAANQSIRNDRNAAFTNLESIESYLSLDPWPSQFETLNIVNALLRESKVSIAEWSFDAGKLELLVQADRPLEAPFFIEMFERTDLFSNVSGTVGNQQRELRLSMQIDPRQWPTS